MTAETVDAEGAAAPLAGKTASGLRWWREILYILAFYAVYSAVRNTQGSASVSARHAFNNARQIIRAEDWLRIFHEEAVQQAFLGARNFIRFWNVYYGTAHFVVTAGALIWLFRAMPERYARWRNTLAWTTGLALVGFALYPLMPPRLLHQLTGEYRFVDTLQVVGGLWSFDSGAMAKVSNQYAAMPSLHCAWAGWCVFVAWPRLEPVWARAIAVLYPILTVFCIVVTANHYFLDALGGAVVLAVGFCAAVAVERWVLPALARRRRSTPGSRTCGDGGSVGESP